MSFPRPEDFHPELSESRLSMIAEGLLNVRYEAERDMQSPLDDNYTRETAIFGRQRNWLIHQAMNERHEWLTIQDAGLGVTFGIGGIPCRFFTDDSVSPKKRGFFKRLAMDQLFAPTKSQPEMWRFVVEKAMSEDDGDQIFLVGFNTDHEKVSEWRYREHANALHGVGGGIPESVDLPPAAVSLKARGGSAAGKKTGSWD